MLGYTQAFSSLGGLLVSAVYTLLSRVSVDLPAIQGSHEPWRYLLISGVIPAIPLIVIRPFLPESPEWSRKKAAGTLKRPSLLEVFRPQYRRVTLVTTLMFACAYGAAFGAIQQLPQLVPALPESEQVRIGELAARCGVSIDTVRFYERSGLLPRPARGPAGYRLYGEDDESRLRFVRQAQANGLTRRPRAVASPGVPHARRVPARGSAPEGAYRGRGAQAGRVEALSLRADTEPRTVRDGGIRGLPPDPGPGRQGQEAKE